MSAVSMRGGHLTHCVVLVLALILLIGCLTDSTHAEPIEMPLNFVARADELRAVAGFDDPLEPREPSMFGERLAQLPPEWAQPANTAPPTMNAVGGRSAQIRPRGSTQLSFDSFERANERVWIVSTPTQINIFGAETGTVELGADRIVLWTTQDVMSLTNTFSVDNAPVEIYLEGNIEVRQGGQVFRAERMYFDASSQTGVILEADMLAEIPGYKGKVRVKADVLSQLSPTIFQANNAAFTTSRLGVPRYWIQSDALTLDTGSTALINRFASQSEFGQELSPIDRLQVSSRNSAFYLGGVPVFKWPSFSTDLARNPSLYLDRIRVGSDSVFGTQVLTQWNMFQLLGITPEQDTDWTASLDWLSDRGIGFGTDFDYERDSFFGRPATSKGLFKSWFINDSGLDNLGADRRAVPPEEDFRGRVYGRHRTTTPLGLEITAELGWTSDRNFREQFYEEEWDLDKDQETRLQIKKYLGSDSLGLEGAVRLNDFFTQTERLPRLDHYSLGRSFFGNRLTWYEHSHLGYERLRSANAPNNAFDSFSPLAWDVEAEGIRAASRHEVDLPFQLGGLRVVPFAMGEVAYWQEDIAGDDVTRLLGQAGVRTSLPFWRVDPGVQNELLNLNGLAHKFVIDAEFMWADASENLDRFPLYDNLDDDAVEFFRRRFLSGTFAGNAAIPLKFDERNFAFRNGMQRSVTAPSTEIADDLMIVNLGLRQRLQTKRGVPGQQRIVDWLTFDVETTLFPRADRDNFGQQIGPTLYDMRWHVGDRTTLLSDGYFDFFGSGLRTVSIGAALSRPASAEWYIGYRSIEGPISSNVLTSSVSYRLSPKWIWNYGSSFDFSETGNIGQSASIVRVGESFLVSVGAHYDRSRDNLGLRFDIVPRLFRSKYGRIGGSSIAPASALSLE